jgi:predicted  nucleic acid-binding Zn-ribbon protein
LQAQKNRVARQEEALKAAQDGLKRLKVTTHEKEVSLKGVHGQIAKYEKQLNEAAGKKEYDALKLEVANARKESQRLEDEILAGMEEIELKSAELPTLEKALKQAREEAAQFERDSEARLAGLREQLAAVQQQVAAAEAELPAEIKPLYQRLINARGADGLTVVQNRTCVACYTGITPQNYNELLMEQFVMCKSCGRILYLPAAPAAS